MTRLDLHIQLQDKLDEFFKLHPDKVRRFDSDVLFNYLNIAQKNIILEQVAQNNLNLLRGLLQTTGLSITDTELNAFIYNVPTDYISFIDGIITQSGNTLTVKEIASERAHMVKETTYNIPIFRQARVAKIGSELHVFVNKTYSTWTTPTFNCTYIKDDVLEADTSSATELKIDVLLQPLIIERAFSLIMKDLYIGVGNSEARKEQKENKK